MNSFLNPHNGTSLTGVMDITAHSISLFQENEQPQNIKDIFIHNMDISTGEPYDVQIDELGENIIQMYQLTGIIKDTKVGGLESLLNYMNENFFNKNEPAVNEHNYHITRKRYNQDLTTHNIRNVDKSRYYKKPYHIFSNTQLNIKKTINHKQFNELHNQNK